ncbi:hypothetical protein E7T06_07565 [Deinococcus sp. Arct2-2]|uniref:hypothetical protein n=1 Tax=Deinococcus sp. Arct2-2 TaxID=2568653 RepID=UPI0010A4D991|nr:hypothetical protein [Deinococcus sp. Arct2-2]THF70322.1 hypothetical protein E7T06_07565 [Deinococcus sp. Arct2-2]
MTGKLTRFDELNLSRLNLISAVDQAEVTEWDVSLPRFRGSSALPVPRVYSGTLCQKACECGYASFSAGTSSQMIHDPKHIQR